MGTRDRLVVLLLLAAVDDDDDDKRNDEDGKNNVVVALNNDRLVVVDGINATDNAAAGNRIARKIMNFIFASCSPQGEAKPVFSGK